MMGLRRAATTALIIEDAAHDGAPAPNNASATQAPAVPIQRRHADQGSDLLMCQPAQLGQFSKERTTHHGPDARHTAQQIFLFTPERRGLDSVSQVLVQHRELLLQPSEMGLDLSLNGARRRPHAVLFRHEHFDQLSSPREERTERLCRLIRQRTWGWPHRLGKAGQDLCINRVRLGELAGGSGKIAHLPGG